MWYSLTLRLATEERLKYLFLSQPTITTASTSFLGVLHIEDGAFGGERKCGGDVRCLAMAESGGTSTIV